ncbi:hypothetical protein HETIRDRAFT_441637 [Heterobasidion irregulare TC 32-1]|uniref:Uncharacterized protein n=1 Tax=Heterobasidion irregulare (strain TC 32-1) TaxID=747525 RepID=W4JXY6_HETIT|nr:uncharacterized protein HETIRDRAFT_441637 [Heterobasidion irregulare TC 32-1]ETW78442.1 hypothetical protein HETIRDRAFT_441637 [Heterobasidion irregulare TC 32-1]
MPTAHSPSSLSATMHHLSAALRDLLSSAFPCLSPSHRAMSAPNDVLYFPKEESAYNVTGWAGFVLFTPTPSEERPRIASIEHCKRKRGVFHEFLIIRFEYPVLDAPPLTVPIIVERTIDTSLLPKDKIRPGADLSRENGSRFSALFHSSSSSRLSLSPSSVASSSSSSLTPPAFDRIIIPPNGAPVSKIDRHARHPYEHCRKLTFNKRFTDYDLAALLLALQEYAPDYALLSRQCYWYATVIYDFFRERLIGLGNEDGKEVEFNVDNLKDERGRFLTIFTIQPPEPPLGKIKSEFEKQLAALLDERAREDHPAAKWVRSQEEARAAIAKAEEEAAARERAEAAAKEEAAARERAEAARDSAEAAAKEEAAARVEAEATAKAAEAAATAAEAAATAAAATATAAAAAATAAAAAAKAADARAVAAEAAAEAEAAARALLDDEVALLRQQLAALNHAGPSPAA